MQGLPLFSLLAILLLLLLPKTVRGCNNRVIVLKPKLDGNVCYHMLYNQYNGFKGNWVLTKEKCRTCQDSRDVGNGTLPPTPESTTSYPSPTTPIPIGDCECGQGIKWEQVVGEDGVEQLNRPWMVHFR